MTDADGRELHVGDRVLHWLEGWNGHKPRLAVVLFVVETYNDGVKRDRPYVIVRDINTRLSQRERVRFAEHVSKV